MLRMLEPQKSSSCTMRQSMEWSHCGHLTWLSTKVGRYSKQLSTALSNTLFIGVEGISSSPGVARNPSCLSIIKQVFSR